MPVVSIVVVLALAGSTDAPRDLPTVPVRAPAPAQPCVNVDVNGERVRPWACLQQKLTPPAAPRAPAALPESERLMRQPGNQMLQYNLEGTRQRMGNALGTSVVPQRPAR